MTLFCSDLVWGMSNFQTIRNKFSLGKLNNLNIIIMTQNCTQRNLKYSRNAMLRTKYSFYSWNVLVQPWKALKLNSMILIWMDVRHFKVSSCFCVFEYFWRWWRKKAELVNSYHRIVIKNLRLFLFPYIIFVL